MCGSSMSANNVVCRCGTLITCLLSKAGVPVSVEIALHRRCRGGQLHPARCLALRVQLDAVVRLVPLGLETQIAGIHTARGKSCRAPESHVGRRTAAASGTVPR